MLMAVHAGFMVGSKAEAGGIAKDGAKLVMAVACAPVSTAPMGGAQQPARAILQCTPVCWLDVPRACVLLAAGV